jgi:hypothetical protein
VNSKSLSKQDAAVLSARWTEGVLLKRDVFSTVERGRFRGPAGEVDAVLRRLDLIEPMMNSDADRAFIKSILESRKSLRDRLNFEASDLNSR